MLKIYQFMLFKLTRNAVASMLKMSVVTQKYQGQCDWTSQPRLGRNLKYD